MHGIDPVQEAIAVACQNRGRRDITFSVASASMIPYTADSFDIAHLRGVLHHMDHPDEGIREALRVAHRILVIEPNGYNPALKILERVSRYHRHHGERSFRPSLLDAWVEGSHGDVEQQTYAGLVPFFCPDPVARVLKTLEPIVEALPVVRSLACAVYVFTATRPA
jgi:SAM-dependent methyltransferase